MQRFARVDIADPGDDALVEQGDFERDPPSGAAGRQGARVERPRQRLETHPGERRVTRYTGGRHEVHHPEPPGIVEGHRHSRRHREDDVIVTGLELLLTITRSAPQLPCRLDAEPSGHAQVHDQGLARGQIGEQIFPAARERAHGLTAKPAHEVGGKGLTQILPVEDHAIEARTSQRRFQCPPDTLDFWQFGHRSTIVSSGVCLYPETMSDRSARTVYSTETGSICPTCGWPARDCKCSSRFSRSEPLPARIVAKLRMEKTGRGGKTVTVVYDLPRNPQFLKDLASELKRACGAGGAVVDNTVEIQGDLRDRIRAALQKKGWTVKG